MHYAREAVEMAAYALFGAFAAFWLLTDVSSVDAAIIAWRSS